jgi:lysophospholipase L1-like esterase
MKKLLFILAAAVTIFIAAELACRFALPEIAKAPPYMRFSNPHRQQSGFVPDDKLFWKLKANNPIWQVNASGFRGPDLAGENSKEEIRILCLGDSCTFGLGAGGVPYEQTYPALLGETPPDLHGASNTSLRFRGVNFGCPGYTSYQGLLLLRQRIAAIKPDIVIAYFGINDGFDAFGYSDKDQRAAQFSTGLFGSMLNKSALYSSLTRLIIGVKQHAKTTPPMARIERVNIEDYHANLDDIAQTAKKFGAKAYFIAPPYLETDGSLNCEIHRVHEPSIDVMPELRRAVAAGGQVLFPAPDNVHPTPAGHASIARAITKRLARDMDPKPATNQQPATGSK